MTAPTSPSAGQTSQLDLAAMVAARLCHDFISPASAIVSGLDLLEDPGAQDMREDAMGLIAASARKLVDHLQFCRVAFGASSSAESFDARELETLAFEHIRAELVWDVAPAGLNKASARAALNLAQIAGGALPSGGVATLTGREDNGWFELRIESVGPRARLRAEVLAGLTGEPVGDGLAGQWIQPAYVKGLIDACGGALSVQPAEGLVTFTARVPL